MYSMILVKMGLQIWDVKLRMDVQLLIRIIDQNYVHMLYIYLLFYFNYIFIYLQLFILYIICILIRIIGKNYVSMYYKSVQASK